MRFNIGDMVQIKSLNWYKKNKDKNGNIVVENTYPFTSEMTKYCNKTYKIIDIRIDGTYTLSGGAVGYTWRKWMFQSNIIEKIELL